MLLSTGETTDTLLVQKLRSRAASGPSIQPRLWSWVSWLQTARRCLPTSSSLEKEWAQMCTTYKVLRYNVLPWLKTNYPKGKYVWTQDGAPCHTAKKVQQFCKTNFADFWPAYFWPPSSPDLNPLDYAMWGVLERATNKTSHPNIDSLKAAIIKEWDNLSEDFIVQSCCSF